MSTAPKIASYDAIFEYFLRKNLKFRQVETLGFEPFLPRMSPEMIFDEVAPQIPKNKVDKTIMVLSIWYIY